MAVELVTEIKLGNAVFPVAQISLGDAQMAWAAFEKVTANPRLDALTAASRQMMVAARAALEKPDTEGSWDALTFLGPDNVSALIKLIPDTPAPSQGGERLAAMQTILWLVCRSANPGLAAADIKAVKGINPADIYAASFIQDLGRLLGYKYVGDDEPSPGGDKPA